MRYEITEADTMDREIRPRSKRDEIADLCIEALEAGELRVQFSAPRCWEPPQNWPPVELVRQDRESLVFSAPAGALLDALLGE